MNQTEYTVIGAKSYKGEVDGTFHDFTKLIVLMPLYSSDGSSSGYSAHEMRFQTSDYYNRSLKNLAYPFKAKITTEQAIQGKRFVQIVTAVDILPPEEKK